MITTVYRNNYFQYQALTTIIYIAMQTKIV